MKFKRQLIRAAQCILVFGAAAMIMLYFLGYYDLSFIDRDKLFGIKSESDNPASDFFSDIAEKADENEPEEAETSGNSEEPADNDNVSSSGADVNMPKYEKKNVSKVYDSSLLENKAYIVPTVEERIASGYAEAEPDARYDSKTMTLGKMTFSFKLPTKYSVGRRLGEYTNIVFPDDDSEPYAETKTKAEYRPAIELYMGYILMDNGDDIYLISSDGTPLSRLAYFKYSPANARNSDGKPLFMKKDDDGTVHYFSVSDDGKNFVYCDFDPLNDGIGLRFDYPESFGKSDSTAVFVDTIEQNGEKRFGYIVKNADGETVGQLTDYKFTSARAFTENRGAVTEKKDRGAMYFVNENGSRAFETVRTYVNEHDRYVTEYMLPPLSSGIESLGFYYFDSGLTRVRKQTVDYYNYAVRGVVRVVEDKDSLIRPDGSEYFLPEGYTLKGYSEGMILLMRDDSGKYGILSAEGEWIAQPIYSSAQPFIGGLAALETEDGRFGMIDREGNIVLPFTYDSISQNSSGLVAAYREKNGWSIYRLMEKK